MDGNSSPFMFLNLSAAVWIPGGSSHVTPFIQHQMELCNICSAAETSLRIMNLNRVSVGLKTSLKVLIDKLRP